tara:strand:+ start:841 stop:1854 length:1014 start_codon:yes stop_codon:yes gene_type:complete
MSKMVSPQPVLKWAGGKRQLLAVIDQELPKELKEGKIKQYFEPMLGGGAVFFHIKEKYGGMIESYHISDFNWDLFVLYRVIQSHVKELIKELESLASEYLPLPPTQQGEKEGERISMFEGIRKEYNSKKWIDIRYRTDGKTPRKRFSKEWVRRSALTIFLNRTCFNGLYRVNSKGEFNVPHGRYDNPDIVNSQNLLLVNQALKGVRINVGSYEQFLDEMGPDSFVYFDPPYRPLPDTNSFKEYHKAKFGDAEQLKLADQCKELDAKGVKFMLSNSDPKNTDSGDDFFDDAYSDFTLLRVDANRNINSDGAKRGKISEILVRNYEVRGCLQKKLFNEY